MESLDLFLKGSFRDYSYEKYDHTYGLVAYTYASRFRLIYEGDITDTLDYYNTLKLIGIFDTVTHIIYVVSDYYNILYDKSSYEKRLISEVETDMSEIISAKYNKYILENAEQFKNEAYDIVNKFYAYNENLLTLKEKAESHFIHTVDMNSSMNFSIEVKKSLKDICGFITNEVEYIQNIIDTKLSDDKEYRVSSSYSGIPDIMCNIRQYIGFRLVERDKIKEIMKQIENDEYTNSSNFKKLRDIVNIQKINNNIKNVYVLFKYNNKTLEITYPISDLARLHMSEYLVGPDKRNEYCTLFNDLRWGDHFNRILSIKSIKYRGKIIYEDESL